MATAPGLETTPLLGVTHAPKALSASPSKCWQYGKVAALSVYSIFSGMLYAILAYKGSTNNKNYHELSRAELTWGIFNFLNSLGFNFVGSYFFAEGFASNAQSLGSANRKQRIEFGVSSGITLIAAFSEIGLSIDGYGGWGDAAFATLTTFSVINLILANVFSNQEFINSAYNYMHHLKLLATDSNYRRINREFLRPLYAMQNRYRGGGAKVPKGATLLEKRQAVLESLNKALQVEGADIYRPGCGAFFANSFYALASTALFVVPTPLLLVYLSLGQQGLEKLFGSFDLRALAPLSWGSAASNAILYMFCSSLLLNAVLELGLRTLAKAPKTIGDEDQVNADCGKQRAKVFSVVAVVFVLSVFSGASMTGVATDLQKDDKKTGENNSYFSIARNAIMFLQLSAFFFGSPVLPVMVRLAAAFVNAYTAYGLMTTHWNACSADFKEGDAETERLYPVDVARETYADLHDTSGVDVVFVGLYPASSEEEDKGAREGIGSVNTARGGVLVTSFGAGQRPVSGAAVPVPDRALPAVPLVFPFWRPQTADIEAGFVGACYPGQAACCA